MRALFPMVWASCLLLAVPAAADDRHEGDGRRPAITRASLAGQVLTVVGTDLGTARPPEVVLGGRRLTVLASPAPTATSIAAQVDPAAFPPASYPLWVRTFEHRHGKGTWAYLSVTLGAVGPRGPIGPQGPAPLVVQFTGADGPCLAGGAKIWSEAAGSFTYVCDGAPGEKGDKGDKGDRGDTGLTGAQGVPGPRGETGPMGPAGPTGPAGGAAPEPDIPLELGGAGRAGGRQYATSGLFLELAGHVVARLLAAGGGNAEATIVLDTSSGGPDKRVTSITYGDIAFQLDPGDVDETLMTWLQDFTAPSSVPALQDGALLVADYQHRVGERLEFQEAAIVEVRLPAVDGASRDPVFMTVRIRPARTTHRAGSLDTVKPPSSPRTASASEFAFELEPRRTGRVTQASSLTLRRSVASSDPGGDRAPDVRGVLEVSDLKLAIATADRDDWVRWYEEFLVHGRNGDDQELSGSLTLLTRNARDEILRMELGGVGLRGFGLLGPLPGGLSTGDETFDVSLYVEDVTLLFP